MKRILALVLCLLFAACTLTLTICAEEANPSTEEIVEDKGVATPTVEEGASNEEFEANTAVNSITTDDIVQYGKENFEEISVVVTLLMTAFYNFRKHKLLNKAISATNKNAIAVSENSEQVITTALDMINDQKKEFSALLSEYRASEEEKKRLKQVLDEAMNHINSAKLANVEFANELADLLVLANIPNSKKDELYSRHVAAVDAIAEADKMEVNTDDGGEEA